MRLQHLLLPLNCEAQDFAFNLAGKNSFSKTDLVHAYHLFSLTEDITKTDIVTPFGLYEFSRTPFGLRNAPQTFQLLIDDVCCDLDFAFVQTWKSRSGLFKPYY